MCGKKKSNLTLKISQQDSVKKDFTLHLLINETSNMVILHFSLWNQNLSIEERSINLLHDSLTALLFFMILYSIVTVLLELWNKCRLCSCSATKKTRNRAVGKSACLCTNYFLRTRVKEDAWRNGKNCPLPHFIPSPLPFLLLFACLFLHFI